MINNPVHKRVALPFLIAGSLLSISFIYWIKYGRPDFGIDDANIYFVYMKNFALGHGFVWNIGGEHVEGFSSFLWTIIGSVCYSLSENYFQWLLMIIAGIFAFLTILRITLFARKLNKTEDRVLTGSDFIILFALLGPRGFIEWNVLSLMETSLWTYLLVTTTLVIGDFYFHNKKFSFWKFGILLILLNLTRPESIAFNLVLIGILFLVMLTEYGIRYSMRKTLIPFAMHVLSLSALIIWRLYYFGYPLPNTYYAKVSGSSKSNLLGGISYLFSLFSNYPVSLLLLPILVFFAARMLLKWKNKSPFDVKEKIEAVLLCMVFSGLAFPVLTGGDHFSFDRFYQPLLPLLYLSAINYYFWRHYLGTSVQERKFAFGAVVFSIVCVSFVSGKTTIFSFFRNEPLNFPEFSIAKDGREGAANLNSIFADCQYYPTVGSLATGGFAFTYNGKTYDMLGLNSTEMAHANSVKVGIRNHASFNKNVFWKLKPDLMGPMIGCEILPDTTGFVLQENVEGFRSADNGSIYNLYKKIFDDEDFKQNYIPALVKNVKSENYVFGYYSKSFLGSLNHRLFTTRIFERTGNRPVPAIGD